MQLINAFDLFWVAIFLKFLHSTHFLGFSKIVKLDLLLRRWWRNRGLNCCSVSLDNNIKLILWPQRTLCSFERNTIRPKLSSINEVLFNFFWCARYPSGYIFCYSLILFLLFFRDLLFDIYLRFGVFFITNGIFPVVHRYFLWWAFFFNGFFTGLHQ